MNANKFYNNTEQVTESGCVIWMKSCNDGGYGQVKINGRLQRTHRVSWELSFGLIPKGMNVLHRCDTRCCVNPNHLFLGTQKDNMVDASTKKRIKMPCQKGSLHSRAKLSETDILNIREDKRDNKTIAASYAISKSHVGNIKSKSKWPHL